MKADQILQADLLDIIFDNRNKQYGAYALRKEYGHRLYRSISIIFLIIAGLSAFSLLHKPAKIAETLFYTDPVVLPPNLAKPEIPPAQPSIPPQTSQPNSSGGSFIFSDSSDRFIDSLPPINDPYPSVSGTGFPAGPVATGDSIATPPRGPVVVTPVTRNRDEPAGHVDVMPEFPGGVKQLRKFLEKNLRDSDQLQSLQEGEVVSVKVTFIVGYDGKLKGFKVTEDGGEVFNNEVIRVLKKMPDWTPGIAKGENVSVYFTIPVKFTAQ